ncbi:uncharacterized protein RCC_01003 [Ramularia collo-cygni]|uniref:Beta-lactamase-related domain-containing protein n=1 Tax=Ramularia collo-cygni TaxID=112498 RepID=A0A2D3UPY3_9PEZI|nr:uncharacterized protein RCC_01003 [Ramularia collo-cygni]CZT15105.1 uncharacterized protein RCC_01003 [Ramularia collo-cygni]
MGLAIVDGDNVTTKGYGFAKPPNVAATADTLWFTGSTTKAFVGAAAAGILVQDKEKYPDVKWSTPLSKLLPGDFLLSKDYETSHTTLEDAVSHRSGLPAHDLAYGWNNASSLDIIRKMRHLPLSQQNLAQSGNIAIQCGRALE